MKLGFISDIHGNLEALTAVLAELRSKHVDRLCVVGDIVGYGADPGLCLDIILDEDPLIVAGNHDWAAVDKTDISSFNEWARAAVLWTRGQLNPSQVDFLFHLSLEIREDDLLMVHSSPQFPEYWNYLFSPVDARDALVDSDRQICLVGHTHVPFIYGQGDGHEGFTGTTGKHAILSDWRYVVNVGSVGQPRDGDRRASAVILDRDEAVFELIRIPYDVEEAQAKIRAVPELPDFLSERLAWGR